MKESVEKKTTYNRKWYSILGFLISILLLTVAIILSMNEEKAVREAKIDQSISNSSKIEQASSDVSKTVNEVKSQNDIENMAQREVNPLNEINTNTIERNSQEEQNTINDKESTDNKEENITKEDISEEKAEEVKFIKPVDGEVSNSYSVESLQYSNTLGEWIIHRGIDIKADKTTVVKAASSGKIKSIKEDPRYGLSITIEHSGGFQTVYSSLLSSEFVKEGDTVSQGQSIGTVGNSAVFETLEGSHLHFEMLKDGEYVNPDIYIK